jgi:hypothetical protein
MSRKRSFRLSSHHSLTSPVDVGLKVAAELGDGHGRLASANTLNSNGQNAQQVEDCQERGDGDAHVPHEHLANTHELAHSPIPEHIEPDEIGDLKVGHQGNGPVERVADAFQQTSRQRNDGIIRERDHAWYESEEAKKHRVRESMKEANDF